MNIDIFGTWIAPALFALFAYGIGQGLVKMFIAEVPPARFCLFFVVAKAFVNLGFFFSQEHPTFAQLIDNQHLPFLIGGIGAYILDGIGWILYFQSIVAGPITIVGTLSAAYPAVTVLFAGLFLKESLTPFQYMGVAAVILGCIGLAYSPDESSSTTGDNTDDATNSAPARVIHKRWIPLSAAALLLWGAAQTIIKYSYSLPGANEVSLSLFNTIGGFLTLGLFGIIYGRENQANASKSSDTSATSEKSGQESKSWVRIWLHSMLPMGLMAAGDLGVIVASKTGPISIISPLTGAYPLVTLLFAYFVIKEHIRLSQWFFVGLVLAGMFLSTGN